MKTQLTRRWLLGLLMAIGLVLPAAAGDRFIIVASTTSTENSGLFKYLLPIYEKQTGVEVRVVAVGTGQAIKIGERGDADVLWVHDKPSEEKFIAEGYGVKRSDVMYNDFVVVGPNSDPAKIAGSKDVVEAFKKIAAAKAIFASRGDNSGTHKEEQRIWKAAGIDAKAASGGWYRETGSGMGATLNIAAAVPAYALTDRATWISFQNKADLEIVVQGDPHLFNQYGIMLVNPAKHPNVKVEDGQAFIDWVLGPGQKVIADFKLGGKQLFFPNAQAGS